jgi:YVTN family beta-propeller protein
MGAGSVGAGSGSDTTSDPDQAADPPQSTGSTEAVNQPAPGVVIRSSGGALTSGQDQQAATTEHAEEPQAAPQESTPVTAADESVAASTAAVTPVVTLEASQVGVSPIVSSTTPTYRELDERRAKRVVVPQIAEIPSLKAPVGLGVAAGVGGGVVGTSTAGDVATGDRTLDDGADVKTMAAARSFVAPEPPTEPQESLRIVTGVLAAALAPLVFPVPGSPADSPTLWAIFAFVRRQFEHTTLDERPDLILKPRQTEDVVVDPDADAPGAIVDRIDPTTGRVSGRVNVADATSGGLTYALVTPVDPRLGVVAVNGGTGQWTFTPNPAARLVAMLSRYGDVVPFSIAASNGKTVDVRASVDPAEAVVTDTLEVGDGLTYGLAVVGDRLYVLNGSDDAAGNGAVKIIDTASKTVLELVEVGSMPFALAVHGRSLYVGNAGDGTVSVVDVGSNTVVDLIDVGGHPFGLEITGDRLYVADQAGTVSVIDVNDNSELVRIPVEGDPFGVAATADRVYVTNYAGGTVAVVDQATNATVEGVAAAADRRDPSGYPYFAAVIGGRLYVVNSATNALTIIDRSITTVVDVAANTRAVDAIPSGASPVDVVVRGDRLYVGNVNCGTVTVVDVATNQPVETIGVGIQPGLMAATPDGRTIYVADVMGGTVRVISSVRHAADG